MSVYNEVCLMYIDPPSGWRYGFPKKFENFEGITLKEWLINNGYPAGEAEWASNYCRYFGENEDAGKC